MSPRRASPDNPKCPDCGSESTSDGRRKGTDIRRWRCKGQVNDTKCATKPRRFSDLTKNDKLEESIPVVETRDELRDDTHVFLITWAQNNTEVDAGFWAALGACQTHRDADLMVIKGHYRNPTTRKEERNSDYHEVWAAEVMEAGLWNKTVDLCPALRVLADYRVVPTATRPLTGLDSVTGSLSGILGHPKLEMRCIPTPQNELPKQMQTTGACTVENYSHSKAGKKGEFHHTIGALIVEIRGDVFHMRQLNACKDGSFIDLGTEYLPNGSCRPAPRALALSLGDWHGGFTSTAVIDATWGITDHKDSIVAVLRPHEIIWDDVLDQYSRNHHHKYEPFINIAKTKDAEIWDRNDLRLEVEAACEELNFYTTLSCEIVGEKVHSVVKASNHDDALTRYINERNWKNDPVNAEFYLETALEMARATRMEDAGGKYPSAFPMWGEKLCDPEYVTFLSRRGSYMVGDIECGYHGDVGVNGARGNIISFAKIGVKTIIAHAHTPGIVHGAYQVGTSTLLDLEYNRGPSSWSNTHCAVYGNGKRALITIIGEGEWRHQ